MKNPLKLKWRLLPRREKLSTSSLVIKKKKSNSESSFVFKTSTLVCCIEVVFIV
jgi:hypothetical protein